MPYETLTEYESSVLNDIATSDYNQNNGSLPRSTEESATYLWVDEIAANVGLAMNQVKGVLGSLVKKGIIDIDDIDSKEDTLVQIQKKGIDLLWS